VDSNRTSRFKAQTLKFDYSVYWNTKNLPDVRGSQFNFFCKNFIDLFQKNKEKEKKSQKSLEGVLTLSATDPSESISNNSFRKK